MLKKLSLKIRITILCGAILVGMASALTVVSIRNANRTYTDQFVMNFGDTFSISFDGKNTIFGGESGEKINQAIEFAKQFLPQEVKESISTGPKKEENGSVDDLFRGAERKFTLQSIAVAALFVLFGLALIYFITGKALKPVRNLSSTVKRINENNLYEKLKEPGTKDEIASLTTSYNQMLERLATSFAIQKNFAANAAHELRTPLTTTKAGIQVLEMDEEPTLEDYKEAVETAKESNERLIRIVDNLLMLTRQANESFQEMVGLKQLFHEINDELMPYAQRAGVELEIADCSGVMKGNRTLLYRAVYNLVENGIKYAGNGSRVTIAGGDNKNRTIIMVSDTGPGIPSEALEHIFEPFYRVDKSRSRAIGGSGLGLSIVKGIIEKHNGRISVDSKTGKGTTFTVELEKPEVEDYS